MSESTSDHGSESDVSPAQYNYLRQIGLAACRSQAPFCCAGHVPITPDSSFETIKDDITDRQLTSTPVAIRWDRKDGKTISKLTLPVAREKEPGKGPPSKKQKADSDGVGTQNHAAIQDLLDDCAPASFGKDGKDVLDHSYRKAVKLDRDQFSTNFNPYDVGIIGAIAQTLLAGIAKPITAKSKERTFAECLGVVAELYKLNVYSAPSGKFKPHVDTPRGVAQFGTLVVCLPYRHSGGQLRVAHSGEEMTYDWGNQDNIQWAAFYSDCEHEVYEVTAGHRITLTYNLYAHEQLGGVFRSPGTIDMDSFTLYRDVKAALASLDFFPKGGTLGFYCVHAYAHANDRVVKTLPYALKGVDAVVFSIFQGLNLSVSMRAVMEDLDDGYEDDWSSDDMKGAELVSTGLHGIQITDEGDEGTGVVEAVERSWDSEWRNDIQWIGGPRNKEIAVVHLAYGNQASTQWHYSTAAIIVEVPDKNSAQRQALKATN